MGKINNHKHNGLLLLCNISLYTVPPKNHLLKCVGTSAPRTPHKYAASLIFVALIIISIPTQLKDSHTECNPNYITFEICRPTCIVQNSPRGQEKEYILSADKLSIILYTVTVTK